MRKLFAAAAIVMTATIGIQASATAQGSPGGNPGMETEFVSCINELRVSVGLKALETHGQLTAKARAWAKTMADAGEIWHSNLSDGITVQWRRLGENVGMGGSVNALCDAFEASPSHKENLIDPGFRNVGVGVFLDAEGTIFVSEVFMELASQPAPATSAPASGTPSSSGDTAQPISKVSQSESPGGERPRGGKVAAPAPPPPGPGPSPQLVVVLDRLRALDG